MTVTGAAITNHAVGDDFDIVRTITDLPSGTTITKAWLMVKERASDADGSAVITKTITNATTTPGTITDTGSGDGIAELTFHILAEDTDTEIDPARTYAYGIKYQLSNGYANHLETGTMRLTPGVVAGEPA